MESVNQTSTSTKENSAPEKQPEQSQESPSHGPGQGSSLLGSTGGGSNPGGSNPGGSNPKGGGGKSLSMWGKLRGAVNEGRALELADDGGEGGSAELEEEEEDVEVEDIEEPEEGEEGEGGEEGEEGESEEPKDQVNVGFDWKKKKVAAKTNMVDGVGGGSIGKDGVAVDDIELADGFKAGVKLGPGEQSFQASIPTGFKLPPPDGFDLPLVKVAIPFGGVPAGIDITAGIEGGLEMSDVTVGLSRKTRKTAVEEIQQFEIAGSGEFSANLGVNAELALWGGVPLLAAVRAGIRAKAEAVAALKADVGGTITIRRTIPVQGEKPRVTDKSGEVYFNVGGSGAVNAALSLFAGFELFMFKGDLFELTLAEAPIATLDAGARFGMKWENGGRKPFKEPLDGKNYVNFDWLFGKMWKARKLDNATKEATTSKADLYALKDLKGRPDVGSFIEKLKANEADLGTANGELQLLINDEKAVQGNIEGDTTALAAAQQELAEAKIKDEQERSKHWAITNFFRGDIKELKLAKTKIKDLTKSLASYQKRLSTIQAKKSQAKTKFISTLDPKTLDARIAEAQTKANATYQKNWLLFDKESKALRAEAQKAKEEALEAIEKQTAIIDDLVERLKLADASPETIDATGLRNQLGLARGRRTLLEAQMARSKKETDARAQQLLRMLTGVGVSPPPKMVQDPKTNQAEGAGKQDGQEGRTQPQGKSQ